MSFMQKISKAMDKAGKQTAKAVVKGKIMAAQKLAHAEATPEIAEIVGALERLKATKNEISAMADVARYLYDARINQATYQVNISHQMRDSRTAEEDGWSKLCVAMGNSISRLESIHSEHCEKMKEEFVVPLEKFRDVDIREVQKLKLKYKEAKSAYDVACAKEQAAKDSGQAPKMQAAFAKKQETEQILKGMRDEFLKAVEGLERQKNTELLGAVLEYWQHYVSFAKAQNNAIQATPLPDDIDPTNYIGGKFQATTPGNTSGDEEENSTKLPETNFNEYPDEQKTDKNNDTTTTTNVNNNEYGLANNDGMGEAVEANVQGYDTFDSGNNNNSNDNAVAAASTNPFDDDNNNNNNEQTDPYGNSGFSNINNDDNNGAPSYMSNNSYANNDNNNDYTNNNDNNGGGAAAENTGYSNPFDNDTNENNDNSGQAGAGPGQNSGGADPMDFDPYAESNANDNNNQNSYGQNQNGVGGYSVASSQGGFL